MPRLAGLLVAGAAAAALAASTSPVKYIIVLMMENRSFDHLLGHLAQLDPRIDGITNTSDFGIPVNTSDPNSPMVYVNWDAVDGGPVDPLHDFDSITKQVFGFAKPMNETAPVRMNGFAEVATDKQYNFVMSAFNASSLPVMTTLATEFAVFDHWHASCPCPTNPNREYLMSGTAGGMTDNTIPDVGFPQQSHFAFLEQNGISWKIFFNDDPWMAPAFADLRTPDRLGKIQEMPAFFDDLTAGTLPRYSLIEPRMATSATGPSNWQHPDNSVEAGEALMSQVYAALRASPYWEESLLIITYDEHGGFYDHQPTPTEGVPAPDNITAANGFKYDRLGVRVPTIMVSPWIAKGTVVNAPAPHQQPTPYSQWESTSIIASANRIFGISSNMTARDAWAATFHDLVSGSTGLRKDCPMTLPPVAPLSAETVKAEMALPFNDHHLDSINLLCALSHHAHPACSGHADKAAQAALVEELRAYPGAATLEGSGQWPHAAHFPHLHPAAARLLRQEHFERMSKGMWALYKEEVMGTAQAHKP